MLFSAAVKIAIVKTCKVIVIDTHVKYIPLPGALNLYIYPFKSRTQTHFSAAVIAASVRPCIIIVIDTLFLNTHHELVPLTYSLRFIDFVNFYVESRTKVLFSAAVIVASVKPCLDIDTLVDVYNILH